MEEQVGLLIVFMSFVLTLTLLVLVDYLIYKRSIKGRDFCFELSMLHKDLMIIRKDFDVVHKSIREHVMTIYDVIDRVASLEDEIFGEEQSICTDKKI